MQFQGKDIMIVNEAEATEGTQQPKSLVSYEVTDDNEISSKQEDGNEQSESSPEPNMTTCADDEKLEMDKKFCHNRILQQQTQIGQ